MVIKDTVSTHYRNSVWLTYAIQSYVYGGITHFEQHLMEPHRTRDWQSYNIHTYIDEPPAIHHTAWSNMEPVTGYRTAFGPT